MRKMIVLPLLLALVLCSCGNKTVKKLSETTPSELIDDVYAALSDGSDAASYVPELVTTGINENTEEYYLGVKSVPYTAGAGSEAYVQPVTYSFSVIYLSKEADWDAERIKIEQNVNKSKWVCAAAEEALVVRYENVIAVIMGTKTVCGELEKAFLSVVSSMEP